MKIRQNQGFSLIELMIVVAILGLLAAVALPNYTEYIVRTNRADAKDRISEVAYQLERFSTRNRTYTLDMTDLGYATDPVLTAQGYYSVDATECTAGSLATCVVITATPRAGESQEGDGNLSLNTRGEKTGKW